MRIFVTGASSGIGKRIANALVLEGHTVICLSRQRSFGVEKAVVIQGDLQDPTSFSRYLENIDLIIHGAAITHTDNTKLYFKINFEATQGLVRLAENYHVKRFVYVSTRAIGPKGGAYAASKFRAEKSVKSSRLSWVILRLAEVYGTNKDEGIDALINLVLKRKIIPIMGQGQYQLAPVFVGDVVKAFLNLTQHVEIKNKSYTICGPESFTLNEFVSVLCQSYSLNRIRLYVPVFLVKAAVSFKRILPLPVRVTRDQIDRLRLYKNSDFSAARKDLGFCPIRFTTWLRKKRPTT
ncbi:MAG: SDR family NAD(P)-dependent oxidoreductase [Desulfobacteraceae bacterium]|nr:SDR family NAD(P)-dependent oxidoreductase [Desulfobacteraceae bacterium]